MNKLNQQALELRKALQLFLATMDADTQAEAMMEVATVFPKYQIGKSYKIKDVFSYGTNIVGDPQLYQVLQDHVSMAEWPPYLTSALYKAIGVSVEGYPIWVRPLGASDAYNAGDIVSYNGSLYCSIINGNTWSPDEYPAGWEAISVKVEEPESEDPKPEEPKPEEIEPEEPKPEETETEAKYSEWTQPLGTNDAYNTGDIVSYSNVLYRSTIDGNVWAPDSYPAGWEVYSE
jgi:hypothetical protein